MNSIHPPNRLARRKFLKQTTGGVAATAMLGPAVLSCRTRADEAERKTIGIQVGAVSFTDEGVDQVLDILQSKGAVNTIFLTTFTYGRGLAGRRVLVPHGLDSMGRRQPQ